MSSRDPSGEPRDFVAILTDADAARRRLEAQAGVRRPAPSPVAADVAAGRLADLRRALAGGAPPALEPEQIAGAGGGLPALLTDADAARRRLEAQEPESKPERAELPAGVRLVLRVVLEAYAAGVDPERALADFRGGGPLAQMTRYRFDTDDAKHVPDAFLRGLDLDDPAFAAACRALTGEGAPPPKVGRPHRSNDREIALALLDAAGMEGRPRKEAIAQLARSEGVTPRSFVRRVAGHAVPLDDIFTGRARLSSQGMAKALTAILRDHYAAETDRWVVLHTLLTHTGISGQALIDALQPFAVADGLTVAEYVASADVRRQIIHAGAAPRPGRARDPDTAARLDAFLTAQK